MTRFRNRLLAAAGIALAGGLSTGAWATPVPFGINPNVLASPGGYSTDVTATDLQANTNSLVQQIGPTTQFEQGFLAGTNFVNGATTLSGPLSIGGTTGMFNQTSSGNPVNTYELYAAFTTVVTGISGFGSTGTIGVGGFNFVLFADRTQTDTLTNPTANTTGGTAGTINGHTPGDIVLGGIAPGNSNPVLAVGSSISSSVAGFQSTGAPTFSATSSFGVCTGVAGQASFGGVLVSGTACGTFNALSFFVDPHPFYSLDFTSATTGSAANVTIGCVPGGSVSPPIPACGAGDAPNGIITSVVADINFQVPEPTSLALLGSALLGFGALARRRRRQT